MTKGQVIRTTDITDVINTKISKYLPEKNPGGKTTFNGNRTKILNEVKAECDKLNNEKNSVIKASSVKDCIINSMYKACCCGSQIYQIYAYHYKTNTKAWPRLISQGPFRGMYEAKNISSVEAYKTDPRASNAINQLNNNVKYGNVIEAVKLTDILDKFIEYNRTTESTKDLKVQDTCYSSCHTSCHGSSRSRR